MMSDRAQDPADPLSLRALGVATMTSDELARLVEKLTRTARWVAEYRYLCLEHDHDWWKRIPNRPTIGYYLRLQKKSA